MRLRIAIAVALAVAAGQAAAGTAEAATPVAKSQRQALVFIADLSQGDAAQRAFYDFVEFGAEALAVGTLGPRYDRVRTVKGVLATRARLVSRLDAMTAAPGVRAVDLVFVTHGLDDEVLLADGLFTVDELRLAIRAALTAAQESRLRMVFSTACFGASHRAAWRGAGFETVSGSRRIYADAATSFPAFLTAWGAGTTFAQGVAAANAADPLRVADNAAKLLLGRTDVDSTRLTSGATGLRIGSMP